jgi:hypothetical protein
MTSSLVDGLGGNIIVAVQNKDFISNGFIFFFINRMTYFTL